MKQTPFTNWITKGTDRPFYARKKIAIKPGVKRAEAYVCGLGQFNFYINGKRVSDRVLDPAWSDYGKIVYYVKFDVTDLLVPGANMIAAEVGNGWFLADFSEGYSFRFPEFMPPNPNPYRPFSSELILSVHLDVEYSDGEKSSFDTDSDWEVAEHPTVHSNCFGTEIVDGRKMVADFAEVDGETGVWEKALISEEGKRFTDILTEQKMSPIKVIASYEGRYLHTVFGKSVYDFGQNASGMLSFEVRGKAGEKVTVLPAEKLTPEGDVDQVAKKWMPIDVREEYIIGSDDIWEKFEMSFTYIGARFIGIDKDPENIRNVRFDAISSATDKAGSFMCDDGRIMKIYSLIEKAVESNMVSVHTDCPTIERFAWQEENHLMAPSVMYMKSVKDHWEKFLTDTRLSQHTEEDWFNDMHHGRYYPGDGLIPAQAPCYMPNVLPVPGMGDFYNIIGWGSSIILGTYWHYLFYGDESVIRDNYDAGKRYLGFLKTMVNEDGFINNGLGDWGNPTGEYARENVETAFLYADAKKLEYFARILGKSRDEAEFAVYAEEIKDNYNNKLLVLDKESGRYGYKVFDKKELLVMTQAAEAMPLYFGMVPKDRREDVIWQLKRLVMEAGCFKAGEVSQPYIIQTLSDVGMNQQIYDMVLKPEHPSYYAFVLAGETTLGEYWEDNPRSHNHDMMGHIMEWFYNGIAGIKPIEPGFSKVEIKPFMPEGMNEFECRYKSAKGEIRVSGKREGGKPVFDISVPEEVEIVG